MQFLMVIDISIDWFEFDENQPPLLVYSELLVVALETRFAFASVTNVTSNASTDDDDDNDDPTGV